MASLAELIRSRRSERSAYAPERRPPDAALKAIIEAARWAPTAHNMQNFQIILIDDPAVLAEIGRIRSGTSAEFIRENYAQLSFTEDELTAKGTGLLAAMFPPAWREPDAGPAGLQHGILDETMRSRPVVLLGLHPDSTSATSATRRTG